MRSIQEIRAARAARRKSQRQQLSELGFSQQDESTTTHSNHVGHVELSLDELTSNIPQVVQEVRQAHMMDAFDRLDINNDGNFCI